MKHLYITTKFLAILLCCGAMFSCNSPKNQEPIVSEQTVKDTFVDEALLDVDTTLLKLNVESWNMAVDTLRIANCASVIYKLADTMKYPSNTEINALTMELHNCLNQATYGMPTMNDDPVLPIIESCLNAMGIRE